VFTTDDTAQIDTIFKLLPHMREQFHLGRSFGFLVINVCNHGEHYETPCIIIIITKIMATQLMML